MDVLELLSLGLAVLSVGVPVGFYRLDRGRGRKQLGYRVQMDTTATDAVTSEYGGAFQQLRRDGRALSDPSFVLLRIENAGSMHIDVADYARDDDDKAGINVEFPGRRVAGMVVTELSDHNLRKSFGPKSGLRMADGAIELPRVSLNAGAHYKVLVALGRAPGESGTGERFAPPKVIATIKGGVGDGKIRETTSYTETESPKRRFRRFQWSLIAALALSDLALLSVTFLAGGEAAPPLDCAEGHLALTGSTAFAPVLEEAASAYKATCPGAYISRDTEGSVTGLRELNERGREDPSVGAEVLAFSDGEKEAGQYPMLLPRPIAFSLYTLVINEDAGVQDLSLETVREIYAGEVTNWSEVGGNDLPIRLVGRHSDSGTRKTFEQRILGGIREPADTSDDCLERALGAPRPGPVRCERRSTVDVLNAVAVTPGAMGYSELRAATEREDLRLSRIDGHEATVEAADRGAYPFWETEYAYTFGEPPADSVAAGLLRYLTEGAGKDIVRAHGHRPCAELQNPVTCQPSA